jgi:hypothetical protein
VSIGKKPFWFGTHQQLDPILAPARLRSREPGLLFLTARHWPAKFLTRDEARQIAANIANAKKGGQNDRRSAKALSGGSI